MEADAKLDFLISKKEFLESNLKMVQKSIDATEFLIDFFKLCYGRDVDIVVKDKMPNPESLDISNFNTLYYANVPSIINFDNL